MKEFKQQISTLIKNNFNINIYGENGCGKSTLINSLFSKENHNKLSISVTLTTFVNISEFLEKVSVHLSDFCEQILKQSMGSIDIKKWSDLYEILEDYPPISIYIIIDEIDDIQSLLFFLKPLQKLFALANSFHHLKLILVSDFDITKSELRNYFDFSSFIGVCFPARTKNEIKEVIEMKYGISLYSAKGYEDIIGKCIANFEYPFINYNEYIYCIGQNLSCLARNSDNNNNSNDNDNSNGTINEIENSMQKITIAKQVIDNNTKADFDKRLRLAITQQIIYAPIHIIGISLKANTSSTDSFSAGKGEVSMLQQGKNLTESLSRCQKLLLLSAFLASESAPKKDINIFKSTKRTNRRKTHKDKDYGLKSKSSNSFNIHRLIAIYSSLQGIIDEQAQLDTSDLNIELIADIGTLANLNLIRIVKSNEYNVTGRKYICCIGIDFAEKISYDFNVPLSDFLHYESRAC